MLSAATVARMDAGTEPPWMGSRRVAELSIGLVSGTCLTSED